MISQHKRFKQRILIERQVLQLVNSFFMPINHLCGLTEATISRWDKDVLACKHVGLVEVIRKIATLSHSSNDISREVFSSEELKQVKHSDISSLIDELEHKLFEMKNEL